MNKAIAQNLTADITIPSSIAQAIIEELKLLRKEVSFILPQDSLKKYANPAKIRSSYEKALEDYPPLTYGNY